MLRVDGVAAYWPASGIAIGALIVFGPNGRLPIAAAIVIATAAANLAIGRVGGLSFAFGLVNAAQSLFVAWLIERWFGPTFNLGDVRQALGFLVASAAGAALAALGAAGAVSLVHSAASQLNIWRLWFAACLLGIVTVAPLIVALSRVMSDPPTRRELIEGLTALAALAGLSIFIIHLPDGPWKAALPEEIVFPLVLWIAIRCRLVFAMAAALIVTLTIIGPTILGIGHFGEAISPLASRTLAAQTFVMATAILSLLLATLFTEKRQTEAALRVTADRLQLALDGAMLGAFSADLTTRRMECDARAAQLHGHDEPPTTIRESRRFVHTDDLVRIDTAVAAAQRTDGVWRVEYRVVDQRNPLRAEEVRWVALEGSVIFDEMGRPVGLRGVTRDITHRKTSEQALHDRNTQLALAGRVALVGTFTFDLRTGVMQVSPGYAAIHGLPEGTLESSRADWRTRVHPDDLQQLDHNLAESIAGQHSDHRCEYRIVLAGGDTRWIESRSMISYDSEGRGLRVVGANIDVTERRRSEAAVKAGEVRLADALAAGQVIAFEWDAITRLSRRSKNADDILGIDRKVTVNSPRDNFLLRVHADDRAGLKTCIRELNPYASSYKCSFRYVRPDGRLVWLEETAKGEFDASGNLLRVNGLTRDITDQSVLLGELDHRVKNTLAIVSAIASRTRDTSRSMDDFVAALDGRIRCMAIAHELLSLRQWQGVSLAELVRREFAPYVASNSTQIEGPDVTLVGEAGQVVAMVLHELVTNAAKYGALSTKHGRVSIRWFWQLNGTRRLSFRWQEIGGPIAAGPPTRSGYGMSVIRDLIPYELGGTADLAMKSEGVHCQLEIPVHWFAGDGGPDPSKVAPDPSVDISTFRRPQRA